MSRRDPEEIKVSKDILDALNPTQVEVFEGLLDVAVQGRGKDEVDIQSPAGPIDGGVEADLLGNETFTLYIDVDGAIDITIRLSPDGGDTIFEIPESPVEYTDSTEDVILVQYDADWIQVEGSNQTNVELKALLTT